MKALSIKQPWAGIILSGLKDVENRVWEISYRGPLLIHDGTWDIIATRFGLPRTFDTLTATHGVDSMVDSMTGVDK